MARDVDLGFPNLPGVVEVEHHTASHTLTLSESGSLHTNLGAGGTIVLTLPQDATVGCRFCFAVMAAQVLRVEPGAAGAFYAEGGKQTDDKYIWADDEGECLVVVADGNGDWLVESARGVWTIEG